MTDHDHNKPISTFDEICHLTIRTMCKMDMEELVILKKQATRELDRAKMTKGCIDLALSLKQSALEREAQQEADNQPALFDQDEE